MSMSKDQQHLFNFLMEASNRLRAFQMFEIGQGHGAVSGGVNREVVHALTHVWTAVKLMEQNDGG
jgi:hypothetical protein